MQSGSSQSNTGLKARQARLVLLLQSREQQTDAISRRSRDRLTRFGAKRLRGLAFTSYCFTLKLYCRSQSSFYCPRTCEAYSIAILLHDHCAFYALLPTPPFYARRHQILAMAIPCKGQFEEVIQATSVHTSAESKRRPRG